MKITLNWVNRNTGEDGTHVYRSASAISAAALPTPLATVAPGVTTYDDTAVVRGNKFFYRLGIFKGTDFALSNEVSLFALPSSGPGPQTLIAGDYEAGYFGLLTALELFTAEELAFKAGLTSGTMINTGTEWLKFAYKGKILFIPRLPLRHNLTWKVLYDLGLVYGTDDNGVNVPASITVPKNQLKVISKNGDNFKVRLPKGAGANPYAYAVSAIYDSFGLEGSEWNDLMYKVVAQVPVSQKGESWATLLDASLYSNAGTSPSYCQETTGDLVLCRGVLQTTGSVGQVGAANAIGLTLTGVPSTANSWNGSINQVYPAWRPVLEWAP